MADAVKAGEGVGNGFFLINGGVGGGGVLTPLQTMSIP